MLAVSERGSFLKIFPVGVAFFGYVFCLMITICFFGVCVGASPAELPTKSNKKSNVSDNNNKTTFWEKLKGKPTPNRLMLGMFSLHLMHYFKPSHDPNKQGDNWNNQLVALSYHGYFAGTLVNSLYNRAYAAGIERYWYSKKVSQRFGYDVGYRLGLITGYTQKTYWLAKYTPVLPFPQVIFDLDVLHLQLEFSWCFQVISFGFAYRF